MFHNLNQDIESLTDTRESLKGSVSHISLFLIWFWLLNPIFFLIICVGPYKENDPELF